MGELGSRLIRAREARGLSLGDAERDTRISRRYLEALEAEQFDVIPAPVYARGFLRSYSQYLGEDPVEMLSLFPREDDDEPRQSSSQAHASPQTPVSATSASRPVWKRPPRPQPPRRVPPRQQNTVQPPPPAVPVTPADEPTIDFTTRAGDGPMIGVDIGVANPARRINPNLSNNSRSMVVLGIAVAAVIGVVLLAVLISNLGGDSKTPTLPTATIRGTPVATATAGAATSISGTSGSTTPGATAAGTVPSVRGETVADAHAKLEAAGYVVTELHQSDTQPKNTVIDQSPAGDTQLEAGLKVTIVVSDGP